MGVATGRSGARGSPLFSRDVPVISLYGLNGSGATHRARRARRNFSRQPEMGGKEKEHLYRPLDDAQSRFGGGRKRWGAFGTTGTLARDASRVGGHRVSIRIRGTVWEG